ncbi:hypothetical protein RRG08_018516 [Elysia crispata]|uniref:Uncharacterized protein n=1 Tax=Elysia crispata TaxID=231223 RepID=A0AAE1DX53_9GAST|nr:hypothetical protein RRG08_018516 [Elysia crispata]
MPEKQKDVHQADKEEDRRSKRAQARQISHEVGNKNINSDAPIQVNGFFSCEGIFSDAWQDGISHTSIVRESSDITTHCVQLLGHNVGLSQQGGDFDPRPKP